MCRGRTKRCPPHADAMDFLKHFLLALQFFTRIPVTGRLADWVGFSPAMLRASAAHFPGVGWVVGTGWGLYVGVAVAGAGVGAGVVAGAGASWGVAGVVGCCHGVVVPDRTTEHASSPTVNPAVRHEADSLQGVLTQRSMICTQHRLAPMHQRQGYASVMSVQPELRSPALCRSLCSWVHMDWSSDEASSRAWTCMRTHSRGQCSQEALFQAPCCLRQCSVSDP